MSLNLTSDLSADVLIFEEQVSTGIYIFSAITLGFIGCFGFVMNLLVIVTIFMDINVLWTPTNVILINMVVSIVHRVYCKLQQLHLIDPSWILTSDFNKYNNFRLYPLSGADS